MCNLSVKRSGEQATRFFFTSDNNDNRMTNQLANTKHQKPGFNLKAAAKSITPFLNEIEKPNVTFGIPV